MFKMQNHESVSAKPTCNPKPFFSLIRGNILGKHVRRSSCGCGDFLHASLATLAPCLKGTWGGDRIHSLRSARGVQGDADRNSPVYEILGSANALGSVSEWFMFVHDDEAEITIGCGVRAI